MASAQIVSQREGAESFTGEEICRKKTFELLESLNLPKGLLPVDGISEVGYNKTTGFVWLRRVEKKVHFFPKTKSTVSYGVEVTAFVEDRRMKRVTGVKSKELLIWITICDIYIADPNSGKITFGTPSGISKSLPISAFEEERNERLPISGGILPWRLISEISNATTLWCLKLQITPTQLHTGAELDQLLDMSLSGSCEMEDLRERRVARSVVMVRIAAQ